ncbi:MAG: hypothetical protein J3Q66DRAFT_26827 [Benniella sp.]|nr:MAG: hypothetical protein J3Q66DRAFT_26827 [Benniella sp.]
MGSTYRSKAPSNRPQKRDWDSSKDHSEGWWRRDRNPGSTNLPQTTSTSLSPSPTTSLAPTFTPTVEPVRSSDYSQNEDLDQSAAISSPPTALIVGIACGACALLAGALALWLYLRRRKRQQILSNSKTVLMSPRDTSSASQFSVDLESQRLRSQINQDSGVSEKAELAPSPSYRSTRPHYPAAGVESSSNSSAASAPIQAPTFPSPTPRTRKLHSNRSSFAADDQSQWEKDTRSHRVLRQKSSQSITTPTTPPPAFLSSYTQAYQHTNVNMSEREMETGDFYGDVLDFVDGAEPSPRINQLKLKVAASMSLESTPSSSPPQTPTRRRSLVDSPRTSNVGSPRSSKEARRYIQNFPPPPPPSVPPPAIPQDLPNDAQGARTGRSRALTAPSVGKGSQVYLWDSAPPSPTFKTRRPGLSPASSTKNLVILPPSSPPPAYATVQHGQVSRESHHYHQRTPSSVLASSTFVETLNQFCEPLPLPSSVSSRSTNGIQLTSLPIILHSSPQKYVPPRPSLRQHHSHHGAAKRSDTEKGSAATSPRMESTPLSDLSVQIMQTIQALREQEDAPGRSNVSSP